MFTDILSFVLGLAGLGFVAWMLFGFARFTLTEFMSDNPTNVRISVIVFIVTIVFYILLKSE